MKGCRNFLKKHPFHLLFAQLFNATVIMNTAHVKTAKTALANASVTPDSFKWELGYDVKGKAVLKAESIKIGSVRAAPGGYGGSLSVVHYALPDWSGLMTALRTLAESATAGDSAFWKEFDASIQQESSAGDTRVTAIVALFEAALARSYGVLFNEKLGYSSTTFALNPKILPLLKIEDGSVSRLTAMPRILEDTCTAFGAVEGTKPWLTMWYYIKSVKIVAGKNKLYTAYIDCCVHGFAKGVAPERAITGAPVTFTKSSMPDDAADAELMC